MLRYPHVHSAAFLSALALLAPGCFAPASDDSAAHASDGGPETTDGQATGAAGTSGADSDSGGDPSGGTSGAGDTADEPPDDSGAEESGSTSTGEPACDDQTEVRLYLSPDDSNSMSSPVQVRAAVLGSFSSLSGAPVRVWEFLNYYSFDYPPADPGTLRLHTSMLHEEGAPEGEFKLQIAVSSPEIADADRAKMNLTLVLDESGSMSGAPMNLQQETCRVIASSLRAGDLVSMVGWDTQNAVKLSGHEVTGANDDTVLAACNGLLANGGTDLSGGLTAGYGLAQQYYDSTRLNRIVLVSDGGANVGVTD